ncbi:MAG: aminodeoxychorismate synthase component I [Dehalococcoidales bacterium]|nr:aminodeoxychorismate synthase component I [Dehalococcoidales bacterium]
MVEVLHAPLIEELETSLSPVDLFRHYVGKPYCFFLDSGMDPEKLGRYSFMGAGPFLILKSHGETTEVMTDTESSVKTGNPLDILNGYLEEYRIDGKEAVVPFTGGAAGYISYDICHFIEKLPKTAVNDLQLPEVYFAFYDVIIACDNLTGKTYIISTGFPEKDEPKRLKRAEERLLETKTILSGNPPDNPASVFTDKNLETRKLVSNFTHEDYLAAVEKTRRYIIDGDIFEVNISQRFETEIDIHPWELYLRLREINPAPFAAYLDFDEVTVVSASPERFIRGTGDMVETRPIKGTIRRGSTPEEDKANAKELLGSAKNHAENMMIVDLERNDLGRVCRFGTVKVTELAILETFPTVFHLTSTVVGQLREENGRLELLKATLPGGSITGAPKVRSMEIIDELEPTCRSIYTGNIGYLSFNGNMDLSIVIRTFLLKGNRAYFQAGGAVVYDSEPESEYQETIDKVRALMSALDITI